MEIRRTPDGYRVKIFFSSEDDCFIADVIDFQYCSAHGATVVEAMQELLIAKDLFLESTRVHGDSIPVPLGDPPKNYWNPLVEPRHSSSGVIATMVPRSPGVYAWFFGDELVYVGMGSNLRRRLRNHLSTSPDLSRSAFRRNVSEFLSIAAVRQCRVRPTTLSDEQISPINKWIRRCDVAFTTFDDVADAEACEMATIRWLAPRLNRDR